MGDLTRVELGQREHLQREHLPRGVRLLGCWAEAVRRVGGRGAGERKGDAASEGPLQLLACCPLRLAKVVKVKARKLRKEREKMRKMRELRELSPQCSEPGVQQSSLWWRVQQVRSHW